MKNDGTVNEKLKAWKEAMSSHLAAFDAEVAKPNYGTASPSEVDRTCLTWWFPRLVEAGLPVPETRFVSVGNHSEIGHEILDGVDNGIVNPLASILVSMAVSSGIGFPCFLRTGHFSGKHAWENTCFVKDADSMAGNIARLGGMEALLGANGSAKNPYCVWVVREMLPTIPRITCQKYGNFPVTRELRVFVDGKDVVYHTPYWPADAIEQGLPVEADWKDRMDSVTLFTDAEFDEVLDLSSRAGEACGGRWSVDILETENGWYVTDMAIAELSYGYDHENYTN